MALTVAREMPVALAIFRCDRRPSVKSRRISMTIPVEIIRSVSGESRIWEGGVVSKGLPALNKPRC